MIEFPLYADPRVVALYMNDIDSSTCECQCIAKLPSLLHKVVIKEEVNNSLWRFGGY